MNHFIIFLFLIPFPALAQVKDESCKEESTHKMHECAFRKLVQSEKKLREELKTKTFEEWVMIRQRMCEGAYLHYKGSNIYSKMIMECSIEMNNILLQKTKGLN